MIKPKIQSILTLAIFVSTSLLAQNDPITTETNQTKLLELANQWRNEKIQRLKNGQSIIASQQIETKTVSEEGVIAEYQGVGSDGRLLFYITDNLDAARTLSTDKVWPGGALGLSLSGGGMIVGEWDGGEVRTTHQEFTGRAFQLDSTSSWEDHPTHVAGTMIAAGIDASAKGMAYAATLRAFDWNFDDSEMAAEAAGGLLISNHSYGSITGWRYNSSTNEDEWWGDTTLSGSEDYKFGQYNSQSQSWDLISRNAPYYLIVKSAGNDRGDAASGLHYLPLHNTYSSTTRPDDGGTSGYDCISTYSGAKNILTIGAVNAIPGGYSGASSVVMSSFSGWGPTDDGRIKPDVVANGVGVYSCLSTNNTSYASWNGTSMAAPNAAGSLVLVQQAYSDKNSTYMKSATLKALTIHTADEAGPGPGPDYQFGYGLINIASAVLHINDTTGTKSITETSLTNSNTYSFNVTVNGFSPIKATLGWTDVPGSPPSSILNNTTPMLVNDLDIRIIRDSDSTVYSPYILNPSSPSSSATTGDNFRDNLEQIFIASPTAGSYTVIVSHKGSISGGSSQDFSLIFDGGIPPAQPLVCNALVQAPAFWDFDTLNNCSATAGDSCLIPTSYGWLNETSDDIDWTIDNGGTTSGNTGPSVDFTTGTGTGKYLYVEASTSGVGFPNKQAILYSPCIDLDTLTNSELFFAYHMYGATMGSLSVEVFNGFGWSPLWTSSGDSGDVWKTAVVDLSLYDGDTIQLRFVGVTGSNFTSDMAIDGIEIREHVSCPGSYNFNAYNITDTTAVVSWVSNASFWKISLNIKGGATVIPPVTINFNPVLFGGLVPNTTYEFYVQDSCGFNDTSAWVGPFEFTTSGPILNPTSCGLSAAIPDDNCPNNVYLPVQVTAPGTQLGIDVFLTEVKVILAHTWDSDLRFSIASPAGDTVLLSSDNGGSGVNYGNPLDATCTQTTTFNMSALLPITSGTAPFIGSYIPEDSLSKVHTGSNPNGIWKFIVCDAAGGDVGSLEYLEFVFDTLVSALANCDTMINSFPAYEDFDQLNNCSTTGGAACVLPNTLGWVNSTNDDIDWTVDNATTGSSNTGPSTDYTSGNTSGKFLYTEASTAGFPNKVAILNSPCFALDIMTNTELSFAYHMYGSTMGSLTVEVFNGISWVSEWTLSGDQGDSWFTANVDLSAYDGDTIQLRFVGITGSNYFSDMAIDGIELREAESCPGSYNFNVYNIADSSANFSWVSNASFWKIRLDIKDSSNVIPPTTINFNPVLIGGLIPNTTYEIFIQDSCGLNDTSAWVGPIEFTTSGPLTNPSVCGINAIIPDNSCPNLVSLPIQVTAPGSQLGTDVFLKEVRVIIEHTYVGDLYFGIASPAGDTILLSGGNGGSGINYGDIFDFSCSQYTVFTMAASTPISGGTAPFLGSYIPDEPFSNLYTGFNPNGIWQFIGCDNVASDEGSLLFIELVFDTVPNGSNCLIQSMSISNDGIDTICMGDTTSLYPIFSPLNVGSLTYQWYRNGQLLPGENSYFHEGFQQGNYNVIVTDSNNCSDSASMGQTLEVLSLPVVTITNLGNDVLCPGDTTTLSSNLGMDYYWIKNGTLISPSQNGQTLTVVDSGNYNVMLFNDFYCWDTASTSYSIGQSDLPTIQLNVPGNTTFCEGESTVIKATGGLSYIWFRNGTFIAGATGDSLVATQDGYYNAYGINASNCGDTAMTGITINILPKPTVSITNIGASSFCLGDSTELVSSSGSSYQWYKNGVAISGANSANLIVNDAGAYNVNVTASNTCTDTASISELIVVNNLPNVSINSGGLSAMCFGDSLMLNSTLGSAYQWYNNGNIVAGATSSSYVVSDSGSYNVVMTNANNCSDSASMATEISVNDLPAVTLNTSGVSTFCQGGSVTINSLTSGSLYSWFKDGSPISGATSINYVANSSGIYNVVVEDANSCSDSAALGVSVVVNPLPTVSVSATGNTTFCDRDSVLLTASSGTSHQWYRNGNAILSATSNSYLALVGGNYNVIVSDVNNCADSATSGMNVTVNPLPIVSITASGSTTFCEEDSVVLTSSPGVAYQWWYSGIPVSSATSQSTVIKSGGFYNVEVTDANGCTDSVSTSVIINTHPLPVGAIIQGDTSICDGDTAWLTVNPTFQAYNWIDNGMANGWGSNQSYAIFTSGNFTVIVEDNNSCTDTVTNSVNLTINSLPVVSLAALHDECNISPPFTLTGGSPVGGSYSGNGVSGGQFDPGAAGPGTHDILYQFIDGNSCSDSAVQPILVKNCTGIDENGSEGKLVIYPNPTSGIINIEFDNNWTGELNVQLFTVDGALVTSQRIVKIEDKPKIILNIEEQSSGIYLLHLTKGEDKWIQKIILEKNF